MSALELDANAFVEDLFIDGVTEDVVDASMTDDPPFFIDNEMKDQQIDS